MLSDVSSKEELLQLKARIKEGVNYFENQW
jgi:hypothetical protein